MEKKKSEVGFPGIIVVLDRVADHGASPPDCSGSKCHPDAKRSNATSSPVKIQHLNDNLVPSHPIPHPVE